MSVVEKQIIRDVSLQGRMRLSERRFPRVITGQLFEMKDGRCQLPAERNRLGLNRDQFG